MSDFQPQQIVRGRLVQPMPFEVTCDYVELQGPDGLPVKFVRMTFEDFYGTHYFFMTTDMTDQVIKHLKNASAQVKTGIVLPQGAMMSGTDDDEE